MRYSIEQIFEYMEEALADEEWDEYQDWNEELERRGGIIGEYVGGTDRNQDMIPALVKILKKVWDDHVEIDRITKDLNIINRAYDNPWWNRLKAFHAKGRLMEYLNEHAPPGYYFGESPYDEGVLGYWRAEYEG